MCPEPYSSQIIQLVLLFKGYVPIFKVCKNSPALLSPGFLQEELEQQEQTHFYLYIYNIFSVLRISSLLTLRTKLKSPAKLRVQSMSTCKGSTLVFGVCIGISD